uniref:Uncharacterized protein n=1 Tax=Siphoviridae sp. ctPyh10 TaxID=2827865 RepID=A0A8S5SZH9_9CAUD|nr:MAG TPA: hypothetical protein [Siphoviridae sp. ctPyh10]
MPLRSALSSRAPSTHLIPAGFNRCTCIRRKTSTRVKRAGHFLRRGIQSSRPPGLPAGGRASQASALPSARSPSQKDGQHPSASPPRWHIGMGAPVAL